MSTEYHSSDFSSTKTGATNTTEVIDQGLRCLSEHLGARETELFVSALLRERFDYTAWRSSFVDGIRTFDDLDDLLTNTREKARFGGNADLVL